MTKQYILPAVLAVVFVLSSVPAPTEMKSQWVEYSHGNTKLKAFMAYDDKITGRRPAVLVAHARSGMSEQTQRLTDIWAKLGFASAPSSARGLWSRSRSAPSFPQRSSAARPGRNRRCGPRTTR